MTRSADLSKWSAKLVNFQLSHHQVQIDPHSGSRKNVPGAMFDPSLLECSVQNTLIYHLLHWLE